VMARAFIQDKEEGLGNFWRDIWRITIYLFLPLASILSLLLITQGVPQNWKRSLEINQYENTQLHQLIPMGPIAIHESIKLLGTNGGGLTQANSAHPFENPSSFTTFVESVAVLIIPIFACFLFGFLLKNKMYAWSIWGMMFVLSSAMAFGAYLMQEKTILGFDTRIGLVDTVIFQALNTATATGASMGVLDWMSPLSNGFYLLLMNLGEICFGGSGMGLVNMLVVLLLAAFILNLLSGQSASFLNKIIPLSVMKLAMFYIIFAPCLILIVLSILLFRGMIDIHHPDILSAWWYALSSWVQNNGGAYISGVESGIWVDYLSGAMMLIGRFFPIMLLMTMAGIIDRQALIPSNKTVFSLNSLLFCGVALVVIVVVTLLAFLPLWSFGPLAGH
jgi:potassium-transporting ATPase potassium-binding subunit